MDIPLPPYKKNKDSFSGAPKPPPNSGGKNY